MKKIALIDGDPMFYIIGHHLLKDVPDNQTDYILEKFHSLVHHITTSAECTHAMIAYSDEQCFRDTVYTLAPYKGHRGEKPFHIQLVKGLLTEDSTYESFIIPMWEADDILSYRASKMNIQDYVICSPDKDLRQIAGKHFDYNKTLLLEVEQEQAYKNRAMQLLTGDSVDNILGIPGFGPVKAEKLIKEAEKEGLLYLNAIQDAYCKHFGQVYGPRFFNETWRTVTLLTEKHEDYNSVSIQTMEFSETEIVDSGMLNPFPNADF